MLRETISAFGLAVRNLRTNLFQTLLSVLGIVIGVAALVTMLCMIDGMEQLARKEISGRTSFENIVISAKTGRQVDGIWLRRDTVADLDADFLERLQAQLPMPFEAQLMHREEIRFEHPSTDSLMGLKLYAVSLPVLEAEQPDMAFGRMLEAADEHKAQGVAVANYGLALRLAQGDSSRVGSWLGRSLELAAGQRFTLVGITQKAGSEQGLSLTLPLSQRLALIDATATPVRGEEEPASPSHEQLPSRTAMLDTRVSPDLILSFAHVDQVNQAYEIIREWAPQQFADLNDPISIHASTNWIKELESGFMLFRLLMGMIVGVAVVVGGVGVMNVLLMSIKERNAEIGIRKAVGAKRKNIMALFLSESIAVSLLGSLIGLVLGVLFSMAVGPILGMLLPDGAPDFRAAYTVQTLITVVIVAVLVGVLFGTYPARQAARLDPVDAIARV